MDLKGVLVIQLRASGALTGALVADKSKGKGADLRAYIGEHIRCDHHDGIRIVVEDGREWRPYSEAHPSLGERVVVNAAVFADYAALKEVIEEHNRRVGLAKTKTPDRPERASEWEVEEGPDGVVVRMVQ